MYSQLQSALFKYAEGKGELQSRRETLEKLYANVEDANIDGELTADLVGDYLFTDADFLRNLSTNHRNVFEKVFDEVKYLYKVATAGSKEARELEKIKKTFEKVYRETDAQKSTAEGGDVRHSLSIKHTDGTVEELADARDLTNEQAVEYLTQAKKGEIQGRSYIPVRKDTPQVIIDTLAQVDESIENRSLVMQVRKAQQAMSARNNGNRAVKHGSNVRSHGLSAEEIMQVINKLDDPSLMVYQTNRRDQNENALPNNVAVFVEHNFDGNEGVAVIEFDSVIDPEFIGREFGDTDYHTVVTIFKPDTVRNGEAFDYAEELLSNPDNIELKIERGQSARSATPGKHPNTSSKLPSNIIIAQERKNVNTKNSLSAENEDLPTRGYRISGKEVALDKPLPLRESSTVSNEAAAEDSETLYTQDERSKRLERKLQRIDKRLEREKADLKAEFENRRQTMEESLGDKNDFVSNRASELYEELRNLKKGVRASESLGFLLDHGYPWSDVKTALLNIKNRPGALREPCPGHPFTPAPFDFCNLFR